MIRLFFLFPLIIFSLKVNAQESINIDSLEASMLEGYPSFEEELAKSDVLNNVTYDLSFLVKIESENIWLIKLKKDATYEYIHLIDSEDSKETLLEKGTYVVTNNILKLNAAKGNTVMDYTEYYLLTSNTLDIGNNIAISCEQLKTKYYCLYHKQ